MAGWFWESMDRDHYMFMAKSLNCESLRVMRTRRRQDFRSRGRGWWLGRSRPSTDEASLISRSEIFDFQMSFFTGYTSTVEIIVAQLVEWLIIYDIHNWNSYTFINIFLSTESTSLKSKKNKWAIWRYTNSQHIKKIIQTKWSEQAKRAQSV